MLKKGIAHSFGFVTRLLRGLYGKDESMAGPATLTEKYQELIEQGYITPRRQPESLEMPSARVYVPTFLTDSTVEYQPQEQAEGNAKLVRDPK